MDQKIIGKNIRQHREERHWTQEELAIVAGIDVRTIQRAENGQNLARETLKAIANAFEITIDQLSKDSQEAALAEFRVKYSVIELQPLQQATDLYQLFGTHAYHFQRIGTFNDEQAGSIAEFEQVAKDYGEIWSDLEPLQRRDAEKCLQPLIDRLRFLEVAVSAGVQSMRLKSTIGSSQLFAFSVLYVAVVPGSQPLRALIRQRGGPVQFA
ncbi:MAG: helix-turn-helix transcriptional regulator [Nitrospira sp.]|nr:helix-turn-helix transcriptional regulator [Nitrospira sp.]